MIPATPEKTEKPTIPVRYIGVSGDTLGKGRVFWATYAYEDLAALKCHDKNDVYTLLPPHLADEWRRLREAEDAAFTSMFKVWDDITIYADSPITLAFRDARAARITFEKQHGIGGGA